MEKAQAEQPLVADVLHDAYAHFGCAKEGIRL